MPKSLLFLTLIGLMLLALAIAGHDHPPLVLKITVAPVAQATEVVQEAEAIPVTPKRANTSRAPASTLRTLDIEPVLAGGE